MQGRYYCFGQNKTQEGGLEKAGGGARGAAGKGGKGPVEQRGRRVASSESSPELGGEGQTRGEILGGEICLASRKDF